MSDHTSRSGLEGRLIPWWSYVLALGSFVATQALMYPVIVAQRAAGKPVMLSVFWSIWCGIFVGFYMIMIGYVLRDSARRGMNPKAWLLLMIALLPSGLGFIVYFLLRQPIAMECPRCASPTGQDFNFCTKCQHQLKSVCTHCQRSLRSGDIYCSYCGTAAVEEMQKTGATNQGLETRA
jgi:hypothetical protein